MSIYPVTSNTTEQLNWNPLSCNTLWLPGWFEYLIIFKTPNCFRSSFLLFFSIVPLLSQRIGSRSPCLYWNHWMLKSHSQLSDSEVFAFMILPSIDPIVICIYWKISMLKKIHISVDPSSSNPVRSRINCTVWLF